MSMKPFAPAWGGTTGVNNSASATAAVVIPESCQQVVITNTSTTAYITVMVTRYDAADTPPTGDAPTLTTGLPVLPNQQIRITVPTGAKVIRTIASAADGVHFINPGNGD